MPGGLQEKSLESAPLVNPCSNIAQQDPIEVLEGGYGRNIGLRCVPGVPPGPSHSSLRELRDGSEGQNPKVGKSHQNWSRLYLDLKG